MPELPSREDVLLLGAMTGLQRATYDEAVELGRDGGGVLTSPHRLRSASLHGAVADADDAAVIEASVRLRLTLDVLDRVAAAGERALIFVDDFDSWQGWPDFFSVDTDCRTPHDHQRKRRRSGAPVAGGQVQTAPAGLDVMLLWPKADGAGLTLIRANYAIHLSRWWNPATEDQSSGRIRRIGQERPVKVHVSLAVLPDGRSSFDEPPPPRCRSANAP